MGLAELLGRCCCSSSPIHTGDLAGWGGWLKMSRQAPGHQAPLATPPSLQRQLKMLLGSLGSGHLPPLRGPPRAPARGTLVGIHTCSSGSGWGRIGPFLWKETDWRTGEPLLDLQPWPFAMPAGGR